jgi:hypothetical protein
VDSVFIHNVADADPRDARFTGFTVFTDWEEVAPPASLFLFVRHSGFLLGETKVILRWSAARCRL